MKALPSRLRASARRSTDDGGYALVAAIVAVAAFAYMAYDVLAADRGAIASASARLEQARLAAAADAGIALAVHGLAAEDVNARWSNDGRTRQLEFAGVDLTVTVEDERGKAPLSGLDNIEARALFAGAGATGQQLDHLVAEFRDWQSDPVAGVDLSGLEFPTADGRPIRHGPFRTVDEMAALQDMTPEVFAKVAPATTVFFEDTGGFDAEHAQPLAKAAMSVDALQVPDEADTEAGTANAQPVEELQTQILTGVPMTVRVVARDRSGARAVRMEIIELTGDPANPYWVRFAQ
jgi:general secretion pathway protein K